MKSYMNTPLLKIEASVMALLVMFSTLSFSVEKHFCGTMLVDTSIFSHAETCGSEAKVCGEEMTTKIAAVENSCCTNQRTTVEGQDELKISLQSLNFDQLVFLKTFAYTFIYLHEGLTLKEVSSEHYSPPILVVDIHIMDQVFLI